MIIKMLTLILIANQFNWDYVDNLHMRIKNEDLVFIGKLIKFDDYYKTKLIDTDGNDDFGEVYVMKFLFSPVLMLKGKVSSEITVLCTSTSKPMYYHDLYGWSGSSFSNGRLGDIFLVIAKKPNNKNIIQTGSDTYNIKAETSNQVLYTFPYQAIILPEFNYVLEGSTPVERAISVLSQAYSAEPHGNINQNRGTHYLRKILEIIPRWRIIDDKVTMYEKDWDGPQIYDFFREKIQPRFFNVAGNDPILKAHALFMAIATGEISRIGEYQQLIDEIDKTHPQVDAENLVMGLFGDKQYALKMLNARLDHLRSQAFWSIDPSEMKNAFRFGLQPDGVMKLTPDNLSLVVQTLRDDPSWQVQVAAASWLNAFRYKHIEAYRDAPAANIIGKEVTNKQAVIDYWLGK